MKATRILIALMLPLFLSGCATLGFGTRLAQSPNTQNANIQVSPVRAPDLVTTDGARNWKDKQGHIEAIKVLAEFSAIPIIASGGVTDLDDVRRLSALPITGIIIGRAIYEQQIDLSEALRIIHKH